MNEPVEPSDAARALSEIERQREQVIRRKIFPRWWWWSYAVLMVVFAAAVESGHGAVPWIGLALFTAASLVIDLPVRRAARAAAPHRSLTAGTTRRTLIGLASFVALLAGAALATGLSLNAAGVPHPGTIAAAVAGLLFALGGPMLVRRAEAMLLRRSRGEE